MREQQTIYVKIYGILYRSAYTHNQLLFQNAREQQLVCFTYGSVMNGRSWCMIISLRLWRYTNWRILGWRRWGIRLRFGTTLDGCWSGRRGSGSIRLRTLWRTRWSIAGFGLRTSRRIARRRMRMRDAAV